MGTIDPIYAEIGKLIRSRRQHVGLTQENLGESIGLTRTSVNNIEHGRQAIQIHMLYAIAGVLDINPTSLLPAPTSADTDAVTRSLPKKMPEADKAWLKRVLTTRE